MSELQLLLCGWAAWVLVCVGEAHFNGMRLTSAFRPAIVMPILGMVIGALLSLVPLLIS